MDGKRGGVVEGKTLSHGDQLNRFYAVLHSNYLQPKVIVQLYQTDNAHVRTHTNINTHTHTPDIHTHAQKSAHARTNKSIHIYTKAVHTVPTTYIIVHS